MLVFVMITASLAAYFAAYFRFRDFRGKNTEKIEKSDKLVNSRRAAYEPLAYIAIDAVRGAVFGAIFYFFVRAAIVTPSFGVNEINPVGMQWLSVGVGFMSKRIVDSMRDALNASSSGLFPLVNAISRSENRFETVLSEPKLTFFDGMVAVSVTSEDDIELPKISDDGVRPYYVATHSQRCMLYVQFIPTGVKPDSSSQFEPLNIKNGMTASEITFECVIDCDTLHFSTDRKSVSFDPKKISPLVDFRFVASNKGNESSPAGSEQVEAENKRELYVEIFQKNRLIQSVPVSILVRGSYAEP